MAKAIIGGLLSGAGKGLVARGQNQREEAAAMREEALERARERRKREFERERDEANREHRSGLLSRTITGEGGKVYGVTSGGETKDLGIRVPGDEDAAGADGGSGSGRGSDGGLMSTEDNRLWDAAIQRHTTESIDGKKTDWAAVEAELRQAGREGLAQLAAESEATAGRIDVESPEWRKAEEQARAEAESRNPVGPDFIRPGGMKEAYGDLSEEEWVNRRTREIYEELTGRGRAVGGGGQRQGSGQERGGGGARGGLMGGGRTGRQSGYGKRQDGTEKGKGFFGELNRPDGQVSTELSIGVNIDGKEVEIPALVPTLTRDEVDHLLQGGEVTDAIARKAAEHARKRIKQGKSPFAQPGEQQPLPEGGSGRAGQRPQAQSGQRADAQPLPTKNGKIDASKLAEGQIYDTPRGLARYLGNGEFESVD